MFLDAKDRGLMHEKIQIYPRCKKMCRATGEISESLPRDKLQ